MPYAWQKRPEEAQARTWASVRPALSLTEPVAELRLWPHRSLTNGGFVLFIGVTAALLLVPLIGLVGKSVLWVVLAFMLLALAGMWAALRRNDRDRTITETLRLWPDRISLDRRDPGGRERHWEANPYWVSVRLYAESGPVPNYLTLKGQDREVEIGSFLSEEERLALRDELSGALAAIR